jgi:hypothetical protein
MSGFDIVVGDTAPNLRVTCSPIPASPGFVGATAILRTQYPDGSEVDLDLTPDDLTLGKWFHAWQAGETDQAGVHTAQVVVTLASGKIMTFPSTGSFARWRVNARR